MREITITTFRELDRLRERLQNPERLLKRWGAMLVSDAKASFDRQALGDIQWPQRYPGQKAPFLNVAGAIADFAAGRKSPLPRRFQPRPAGIDTRDTRNRIAAVVIPPDGVSVGSNSEQAQRLQAGGISTQPITPETKKRMAAFLKPKKTRASPLGEMTDDELRESAKDAGLRYKPPKRRDKSGRTDVAFTIPNPYRDKLGPLFNKTSLETKVHARPFLGVTDQMRADLIQSAEDFIATGSV